jgi:hypothetical protein
MVSDVDIYINNKLSLAAEQEHGDDLRYLALNLHTYKPYKPIFNLPIFKIRAWRVGRENSINVHTPVG